MKDEEKITGRQMGVLALFFSIGSAIILIPSIITRHAENDAWISAMLATILGVLVIHLFIKAKGKDHALSFVQYNMKVFGKWMGGFISFQYILFCFILSSLNARSMGDFMTTQMLIDTPIEAIMIIFILISVFAVRLGIEVIARASEIFLPWITLMIIFLSALILPELKAERIQPILGAGVKSVLQGVYPIIGFPFFELIVLMMIIQFVNRPKEARKGFISGAAIGGALLMLITLLCILALGSEAVSRQLYPTFVIAKIVDIGDLFQRIEAVVAGIWFITLFFKMTLCFYAAALGMAHLLQLNDYRPLVWPLGMILTVLSIIIYPHIVYLISFTETYWTLYSGTFALLIPVILLCISWIRQRANQTNR